MNGQPTVYVSSTYEDLRGERDAVRKVIQQWEAAFLGMESYGASQKRPLAKCVEDVQRSDIYIGIFGWRYGYCPDETPGTSITASEYQAAVDANIPRLVYFVRPVQDVKGQTEADRAALIALRNRLSKDLTPGWFETEADLVRLVSVDLGRNLEALRATDLPTDTLLPYLCDREPQSKQLIKLIAGASDAPSICFLHGEEQERLTRFVDCLKGEHLPKWLGIKDRPTKECVLRLPENVGALEPRDIRLELARALDLPVRGVTERDVQREVGAYPGPVLVTIEVPDQAWTLAQHRWLEVVFEYFEAWPKRTPPKPDLVLFWANYPPVRRGLLSAFGLPSATERRRRAMEACVATLKQSARPAVLPIAESVYRADGLRWARDERVRRAAMGQDLEKEVALLFAERDPIPMAELGDHFLGLLQVARRRTRGHRGAATRND